MSEITLTGWDVLDEARAMLRVGERVRVG